MSNQLNNVSECQEALKEYDIEFSKVDILEKALIHPTYAYEKKLEENNQRLEFLGDTVLGFIICEYLYLTYPEKKEGDLAKIKSMIVSGETLAVAGRAFKLYNYMLMGKGEENIGGRYKDSVIADAMEAVIAAIYLECGYEKVKNFILTLLVPLLEELLVNGFKDYKTVLQELLQKDYKKSVTYKVLEENGPDHNKSFTIGVFWQEELIALGRGKSKKEGERSGAKLALDYFKQLEERK